MNIYTYAFLNDRIKLEDPVKEFNYPYGGFYRVAVLRVVHKDIREISLFELSYGVEIPDWENIIFRKSDLPNYPYE
ncbi:MAG: hypothetical protein AAFR87_31590 [Bacteroidota bacterium]